MLINECLIFTHTRKLLFYCVLSFAFIPDVSNELKVNQDYEADWYVCVMFPWYASSIIFTVNMTSSHAFWFNINENIPRFHNTRRWNRKDCVFFFYHFNVNVTSWTLLHVRYHRLQRKYVEIFSCHIFFFLSLFIKLVCYVFYYTCFRTLPSR